jgi:hypothetical protein
MSVTVVNRRISRGVNARVSELKRGGALGKVFLSKKRVEELSALKSSPFYQGMTLVESRDDKVLFKLKIGSMAEAETFLNNATAAANAVGVGTSTVTVLSKGTNTGTGTATGA